MLRIEALELSKSQVADFEQNVASEDADNLKDENETLQGSLADLNSKLSEKDSLLHQAEDELAKAQLVLSEALSQKEELELNLNSLNEHKYRQCVFVWS